MKGLFLALLILVITIAEYAQIINNKNNRYKYSQAEKSLMKINVNLDSLMLDSIIVAYKNSNQIPGLATIIVKDNKVIWNKNYGYRNREKQLTVEDSTIFGLASVSKLFVATAVMQLWENGIIDLDKNVNYYLPKGFTVNNPHFPNDSITIKMLMNHTSSIQDNWNVLNSLNICGDSPIPLDSFLLDYLRPGGKYYYQSNYYNYQTGSNYNYSNVGASLLALIVENLSGKSFSEYCQDNIFSSLSMNSASWFLTGMNADNIATPYDNNSYGSIASHPICNQGFPYYPAATLRANKLELSNFLLAYINNGIYNDHRILDSTTIAYMISDQLGYNLNDGVMTQGLIWFKILPFDGSVWGHNGSWDGVETYIGFDPIEKYGIVWLQNWSEEIEPYIKILGINSQFSHYANMYGKIFSIRSSINKNYAKLNSDSVLFRTKFSNINNHSFMPHLIYTNSESMDLDSLTLYDDGLHGDLLSKDGIYGGCILPLKAEDFYSIGVSTLDEKTNKYFKTSDISRFTTAGPLIVDSVQYKQIGNLYYARPFVENKSKTTTIKNAKINILCEDSWVTSITGVNLPDIPPGTTMGSSTWGVIHYIDSLFHNTFNLKFDIMIDDWTYWKDSTKLIITGINDKIIRTLTFNLEQNYPNPFNPTTNIQYSIASRQFVTLKIFNVLGQEIETLVNAEKPAGNYQIEFNAADLSSGVYFYRMKAGSFNQIRKMLLIK